MPPSITFLNSTWQYWHGPLEAEFGKALYLILWLSRAATAQIECNKGESKGETSAEYQPSSQQRQGCPHARLSSQGGKGGWGVGGAWGGVWGGAWGGVPP